MYPIFIRFLLANLVLSVLLTGILIIKKTCKHHLTIKSGYSISRLALLLLISPFVPSEMNRLSNVFAWFSRFSHRNLGMQEDVASSNATWQVLQNDWLHDFSVSVSSSRSHILYNWLIICWILGVFIMLVLTIISNYKIIGIKKSMQPIKEQKLLTLFIQCKMEMKYSGELRFNKSARICSPVTFGLFRPVVLLPEATTILSENEIRYIICHELHHLKQKDVLVNAFMCVFRIIYWFNPLILHFLSEMLIEREIVCDTAVLKTISEERYAEYGNTLLRFVHSRSRRLLLASEMGSAKKQIKKRIFSIAMFRLESRYLKVKSAIIFFVICMVISVAMPSLCVFAANKDRYVLQGDNIVYRDLGSYFNGYCGSFVLYDSRSDQYTIYNQKESTTRMSPNSTYKIYSLLFALESGVVTSNDSMIKWDGTEYSFPQWNRNHDLRSAMENSVSWYFQGLDQEVGVSQLQSYINQIEYGNKSMSANVQEYWMDSSLKISPVEQVELLQNFYMNNIDFSVDHVQTVKDVIRLEEMGGAILSGKTGTYGVQGNNVDGWFIGYVETSDNTQFFALHIGGDNASGGTAAQIATTILKEMGIY